MSLRANPELDLHLLGRALDLNVRRKVIGFVKVVVNTSPGFVRIVGLEL